MTKKRKSRTRDLAIDMLKKMYDWSRIQQILQNSSGPGDDILMQQAWKHVGDYFFERQKWYQNYDYGKFNNASFSLGRAQRSTTRTHEATRSWPIATL